MTPASQQFPSRVALPRSSTRQAKSYAFCKVVEEVKEGPFGAAFEGKVYQAGELVERGALGKGIVLECAGPVNVQRGRRSEILWILWQYHPEGWKELGRASAVNWEWTLGLREIAQRALHPEPQLLDVLRLGRDLADAIVQAIDQGLEKTPEPLRKSVLSAVYDRVAGKLAG